MATRSTPKRANFSLRHHRDGSKRAQLYFPPPFSLLEQFVAELVRYEGVHRLDRLSHQASDDVVHKVSVFLQLDGVKEEVAHVVRATRQLRPVFVVEDHSSLDHRVAHAEGRGGELVADWSARVVCEIGQITRRQRSQAVLGDRFWA